MARLAARGARAAAPAHSGQPRLSHQPSDPFPAHPAPLVPQLGMHPRRPVGAARSLVDGPDRAAQLLVALRAMGAPTASPRVVPAGGDAQHSAHRSHPMMGLVRLHELEDLPGIVPVSRANQAATLFYFFALFAKLAVLAAKPAQLLELGTRQAILTTSLVAVRLRYPVADRRSGALKLACQCLRRCRTAHIWRTGLGRYDWTVQGRRRWH